MPRPTRRPTTRVRPASATSRRTARSSAERDSCAAAAAGGKAAPDGRGGRARVAVLVQLDPRDPLDPLEAAPAGGDEPQRRAVLVRERLVAHVRGEQQPARRVEVEAPAVAG